MKKKLRVNTEEKQLYVIEYESTQWCGGQSYCVAWATSEDEAEDLSEWHREDTMRELFSGEYEDEPELEGDPASTVNSCELLVGSEYEEFYNDPQQRDNFYPCVN